MEDSINTVTSVIWIPTKSMANAKFTSRYTPSMAGSSSFIGDEDSDRELEVDTPETAVKQLEMPESTSDELGPEFNMDNYDEEDSTDQRHLFAHIDADLKLAKKKDAYMNDEVSDSEDGEYYEIKDDDVLFVAANVEEDACTIEVYLHDTFDGGMYVHHDFMIASYPLSLEYIPSMGSANSLLAIGAFDPKIDIWELAVQDPVEPVVQLGKKKGHTDAVIALHLCPQNPTALASGSADTTVRLWDLNKGTSVSTLTHHKDKVQSVKWHPIEAGILMTASYDKTVVISDQRQDTTAAAVVTLANDPECTLWSRHSPSLVLVSDEKGFITAHDVRKIGEPVWSIQAHQKGACTSFTDTANQADLLISAGIDGVANVWKTRNCAVEPQLVFGRELGAGPLFSVSSHSDDAALAVFGASCPVLWNITDTDAICKTFPGLPGADQSNEQI